MKKLLSAIILGFLAISLFAPVLTFAQPTAQSLNECCKISSHFTAFGVEFDDKFECIIGEAGGSCYINDVKKDLPAAYSVCTAPCKCGVAAINKLAFQSWGMICLLNTVYSVCNWLFYIMMVAVVIVFVIAGAKYMMAAGDAEKSKGAKGMMTYGIVGLVIAMIAKLVPSVVRLIVGM